MKNIIGISVSLVFLVLWITYGIPWARDRETRRIIESAERQGLILKD